MSDDYAMIEGKRYPLEFGGYDRGTFKHLEGCLANTGGCCQCHAFERAKRVFLAVAEPRASGNGPARHE